MAAAHRTKSISTNTTQSVAVFPDYGREFDGISEDAESYRWVDNVLDLIHE